MNEKNPKKSWWPFGSMTSKAILETRLSTLVPVEIAVQKLRGFISDHNAKILHTEENEISIEIDDRRSSKGELAASARPQTFSLDLAFREDRYEHTNGTGLAAGTYVRTVVTVKLRPRRDRDRRGDQVMHRARLVLASLRSYLMAREIGPEEDALAPEPIAVD